MPNRNARTTSNVNLRSKPGTDGAVIKTLPVNTPLIVRRQSGNWAEVSANADSGYVHVNFIRFDNEELPLGFLIHRSDVATWPLIPDRTLTVSSGNSAQAAIAKLWNPLGGLIDRAAKELKIETPAALGVVLVESSGKGFEKDRMVIRFENHHFWKQWGKTHAEQFNACFRFNAVNSWTGHFFRENKTSDWRKFHGSQDAEWQVYEKAASLDKEAAQLSISMGLPQIMGSNHTRIGYDSVGSMFDAFSAGDRGERAQLIGLFDFIQGPNPASRMVSTLQRQDFLAFATIYNGSGQAPVYADRIDAYYKEAKAVLK